MSRQLAFRIGLTFFGLIGFYLLWCFAYELVVAYRWSPTLAGEGADRFALLKHQNATRDLSTLTIAAEHFWQRYNFPATQAEAIIRAGIAAGGVIVAGVALTITAFVIRKPMPYGSSRFGSLMEAEKKGLTAKRGLILGKLGGKMIVSNDPAHVLVVGPTRSGKGVSFIVPNGFSWEGSSVWFDPKRENFDIFGAYRKSIGDQVFMFSPGENDTHRYNPLDFIRRDSKMPTDAMVVASFIIPEGTGSSEIWSRSARLLLQAMIGYVIASPRYEGRRHLRSVSRMTTTGVDFQTVLKAIVDNEGKELPFWVVDGFNQFIVIEKETRNSTLFNLNTALNPWNSELIAAATSTSDFDIRELRRKVMAVFIGCSVAQLEVYRPIIKILVQQIHDVLMTKIPDDDEPHKVLMMIDEFRQLGRMDALVSKLSINAGYGFRMVLVLQDVGQLDEVYSKPIRMTTLSACQLKLFIQINDQETAEYVSDLLGNTTIEIKTPLPRPGQSVFSQAKAVRYEERAFRTPQDLRQMNPAKAILIVPNSHGFELTKYRYFVDAPFRRLWTGMKRQRIKLPKIGGWNDKQPDLGVQAVARQPSEKQQLAAQIDADAKAVEYGERRRMPGDANEDDNVVRPAPVVPETANSAPAVPQSGSQTLVRPQARRSGTQATQSRMDVLGDTGADSDVLISGGIDYVIQQVDSAMRAQRIANELLRGRSQAVDDFMALQKQAVDDAVVPRAAT